ncbi:competence protein CoiA family protein [Brevibacillus choshinensis]|uniref:competence protein CoiA family protein n=1 Tax=Brevibacillus choshinensis TaxID=54911 RepID=UPI002E22047C|nr:competence protein CoiA family protein [Brevibacillus choshinensis]
MYVKSDVKLEFAEIDSRLIHISERILKNLVYLCPLCKEEVISRKGSQRRHHFSHKPESNCSASEETILHFNAKNYLAYCISSDEMNLDDIIFYIPIDMLDESIQRVLQILGIQYYPLALNKLKSFYYFRRGKAEQRIGNYIADVLVKCKEYRRWDYDEYEYDDELIDRGYFVFEMRVSHEIGEKKERDLLDSGIPFIEAIPEQTERGYMFRVTSMSLLGMLKGIEEQLIHMLSKHFEEELIQVGKNMFNSTVEKELRKSAIERAIENVDDLNLRDYISAEQFASINSITAQAYKSEVHQTASLQSMRYKTSNEGNNYISINEQFNWVRSENILFDLVKKIEKQGYKVELLIGGYSNSSKGKVVGFKFYLPDRYLYGEQLKRIMKAGLMDLLNNVDEEQVV